MTYKEFETIDQLIFSAGMLGGMSKPAALDLSKALDFLYHEQASKMNVRLIDLITKAEHDAAKKGKDYA